MMPVRFPTPADVMRRALELARRGEGAVEPNPLVGAVIVDERLHCLGEGFHREFGGPHAEVDALRDAGEKARGATLYVTLEPCSHHGKTPPCVDAVRKAGVRKVVVGMQDPFAKVNGAGIARLRECGIVVEVGLLEPEVRRLNAPFRKLVETGLPWVHAKWAMTLDGRIATRTGHSQWISGAASRNIVHRLRGRMDAIVVGIGTALADDPQLTARPAGPRVATRVILDSTARLPLTSKLVTTAREIPLLVAAGAAAPAERVAALRAAGAEVLTFAAAKPDETEPSTVAILRELGARRFTNVLIEGGSGVLGGFFDRELIDEAHVFVAPKLVGGREAKSPIGGTGRAEIPAGSSLEEIAIEIVDGDLYVRGIVIRG
jgi:diaminohydroxyphosphoribosylaminopyrimidine deaminase/5-amino-6-(5-phosphoribosylamino)uracil reductase